MQVYSNTTLPAEIIDWPVYMRRALELAQQIISAAPNPRVGCVIVKRGKVVGEGWHSAAGQAHAEVEALRHAGAAARAATAFVTLEPCSHTGRTGPCVEALLAAGVSQVVIAGIDPNPAVSGKGVELLQAAGVAVFHLSDFTAQAQEVNRGYFKRRQRGLPWVTCKQAMSLDGRTALANGDSKWITGSAARADVQLLRARSCAIVTGIGTVLADDPALNVRVAELPVNESVSALNTLALQRQPLRVVLDRGLGIAQQARIFQGPGRVVIYTANLQSVTQGFSDNAQFRDIPATDNKEGLVSVLESLASEFECNEILIEAGATLSTAFIQAGLIDELVVYIAPKLLGMDARPLVTISGLQALHESLDFDISDVSLLGEGADARDIRITLAPRLKTGT